MNRKSLIAASVAALVSTAGWAQAPMGTDAEHGPASRAEVRSELQQAREDNTLVMGDTQTYATPDTSMQAPLSRSEVQADAREAREENTIVNGDTQTYRIPEDTLVSQKSRSEVLQELQQARANGELSPQADNAAPDTDAMPSTQPY
ncbi:DUF4148 domain-containing protein [Aquincola sp. MAHUQ-54]|uniref:DUF4148 domain-containing protein n=1 Tax=Aquincola agrisoli TaxID=3119538 RepID=A0AAW9QFX1_9BURK